MTGKKTESFDVQDVKSPSKEQRNWFKNCCRCKSMKIEKDLVLIKFTLFCWYGAGSIMQMFLTLYIKQLGISISQLSLIFIIGPPIQLLGPVLSGIIADKIGRSKPVLLANIILTIILANSMLLIPRVNSANCSNNNQTVNCLNFTEDGNFLLNKVINDSELSNHYESIYMNLQNDLTKIKNDTITSSSPETIVHLNKYLHISTATEGKNTEKNEAFSNISIPIKCQFENNEDCADNSSFVFLLCLLLLIFYNCTFSNCYRFFDVTTMELVKAHNAEFGKQRFWTLLSNVILTPLSGYLINITSPEGKPPNYATAFYFFDALAIIVAISTMKLNVHINPPAKSMWRKVIGLLKHVHTTVFTINLLILGSCWAFFKFYAPIFLDELNASSFMISLGFGVNCLCGMPFLWISEWWIKKFGAFNLIIFALIAYMFQSLAYSFFTNPWYALLCEMLGIFTIHILWVNVVRHSHTIAPDGLTASVMSTAGGLHFGIGKGTGSLIGLIYGEYGGRTAFRFVAILCGISAIVLITFEFLYHIYILKNKAEKKNEEEKP